ncbi:NADH-quinone oxidoreductase subunit C [Acrasis kona]|uniref:NADH-quinone oxidoreductase subunit C n=1 Tax=Acrasis kona TaxID=1008807 RepID=A0AAW2ZEJ8_9EUKA
MTVSEYEVKEIIEAIRLDIQKIESAASVSDVIAQAMQPSLTNLRERLKENEEKLKSIQDAFSVVDTTDQEDRTQSEESSEIVTEESSDNSESPQTNQPKRTARKVRKVRGKDDKPVFVIGSCFNEACTNEKEFWKRYGVIAKDHNHDWFKKLTSAPTEDEKVKAHREFIKLVSDIIDKNDFALYKSTIIKTATKSFKAWIANAILRAVRDFQKKNNIAVQKKRKREGRGAEEHEQGTGKFTKRIYPNGFDDYFKNKNVSAFE